MVKVYLGRLTTGGWKAGRIGWKLITKTYDNFDPSSSPKPTTDWLVSLCSDLVIGYWKMGEETSTSEDKMDILIALLEHQWMLWDPSDPSCKNRIKEGMCCCSKWQRFRSEQPAVLML